MARAWQEALTRDEINALLETNDWRSFLSIAGNWAIVGAAFAIVAVWPNLLTILLALALIGGRQLGFAVLMHESAHQTLFKNRRLNDWAGNWLCAFPVWSDLRPYRPYHLQHHGKNWTQDDPDLDLASKFPVTRASMRRKVWRDLSGNVGWKRVRATLRRDLGFYEGKTSGVDGGGWRNLVGVGVTNAILFAILAALGRPELYLLWVVAWFTTNSLVTRIRSIAEHNMPTDRTDDFRNSRTTIASWWERLFIAPNRVNYHLEHHLLMTVPFYNLPRLHTLLAERSLLDGALVQHGYWGILKQAASKPTPVAATA